MFISFPVATTDGNTASIPHEGTEYHDLKRGIAETTQLLVKLRAGLTLIDIDASTEVICAFTADLNGMVPTRESFVSAIGAGIKKLVDMLLKLIAYVKALIMKALNRFRRPPANQKCDEVAKTIDKDPAAVAMPELELPSLVDIIVLLDGLHDDMGKLAMMTTESTAAVNSDDIYLPIGSSDAAEVETVVKTDDGQAFHVASRWNRTPKKKGVPSAEHIRSLPKTFSTGRPDVRGWLNVATKAKLDQTFVRTNNRCQYLTDMISDLERALQKRRGRLDMEIGEEYLAAAENNLRFCAFQIDALSNYTSMFTMVANLLTVTYEQIAQVIDLP